MCNENENAQIRPMCGTPIYSAIAEQEKLCRLADENLELSSKIERLKTFLKQNPERFASEKQVELMRGQLEAMENYKRFLSCRIADLALSDLKPTEKE